jgi:hypothetical protein
MDPRSQALGKRTGYVVMQEHKVHVGRPRIRDCRNREAHAAVTNCFNAPV